jgi:tight adherence protein B
MDQNAALVAGLIAISAATLVYALAYPYLSGDAKAQRRAQAVAGSGGKDRSPSGGRGGMDPAKRRKAIADTLKEFESQNKKKSVTVEQRIAQAGLDLSRNSFFALSALCGLVLAAALYVVNGDLLVVAGAAAAGSFGLPVWVLSFLRNRRIGKFVLEFPGAIDIVVRGIRAGLPVADCFRVIATEAPEPVRGEFRQIVEAQALGLSIGEATERLVDRMPIPEASFFSIVVNITQKSGGNLSESLSNLSTVLRDRKKMKGKIQAMASEAKTSAGIIGALPFLVGGAVTFLSPGYIMVLFTTNPGKIVVGCCLLWMLMGVLIMRKMINFDF